MNQLSSVRPFQALGAMLTALGVASVPALGQIVILHSFASGENDGYLPVSDLTLSGSVLYGTTASGGAAGSNPGTVFRIDPDGSNYQVIHKFNADGLKGAKPHGKVAVLGSTVYGRTDFGGSGNRGTLFRVDSSGSGFAVLYDFPSTGAFRGGYNGLMTDGSTVYGMEPQGGVHGHGSLYAFDTVGGMFGTLHSFNLVSDGEGPSGDVILSGSRLYGMSTFVGGTLFSCNTDGSGFTSLHRFGQPGDGDSPYGSLVTDGATLFGMTQLGGTANDGTIFRIATDGSGYSMLHSFSDGETPLSQDLLIVGSTLYGMTRFGGDYDRGMLFSIENDGSDFEVLHSFSGGAADGAFPLGSLTRIGSTLYGTASQGGMTDHGVVFSFTIPTPPSAAVVCFALGVTAARRRRG